MQSRTLAVVAALGTVYVVWGATYLGIALAIETLPPLLMAATRFLLAGALLYVFTRRGAARPTRRQWLWAFATGAPLLALGNGGVTWAQQTVPSGIAALLIATVTLWIVVLDRVVFGRRVGFVAVLGIAVGFGGVALLVNPGGGGGIDPTGAIVLVLAALSWATGTLLSRSAALPERPLLGVGMQMLAGGLAAAVLGLLAGEADDVHLTNTTLESAGGFAFLVVFGSLVAFSAYQWLVRNTRTSLVATYAYANPVVAVALGAIVLDEAVTARTLVAGGIILGAVALIVSGRTAREPAPARSSLRGLLRSEDRSREASGPRDTSRPRPPARAEPAPSGPSRPR